MSKPRTKRVIEDRTKHRPGASMAGYFVVWEELLRPFLPHLGMYLVRVFDRRRSYDRIVTSRHTKAAATDEVRRLNEQAVREKGSAAPLYYLERQDYGIEKRRTGGDDAA